MSWEIHVPERVIVGRGAASRLGLELSASGHVQVLLIAEASPAEAVVSGLSRTSIAVRGAVDVSREGYSAASLANLLEVARGCDAVVAHGGWRAVALARILGGLSRAFVAAVPLSSGLIEVFLPRPTPPLGLVGGEPPPRCADLVIVDQELAAPTSVPLVALDALSAAVEALAAGRASGFCRALAAEALRLLDIAAGRELVAATEELLTSSIYAGLALKHSGGTALTAVAAALHALYGVDPYEARRLLLEHWLGRALPQVDEGLLVRTSVSDLLGLVRRLSQAAGRVLELRELGVAAKDIDLVVEYAWTFRRYEVERDPAVTDKYSIRELLEVAIGRSVLSDLVL